MAKLVALAMRGTVDHSWIETTADMIRAELGPETKVLIVENCNRITVTDYEPSGG